MNVRYRSELKKAFPALAVLIDTLWRDPPPQKIFEFTDSAAPAIEDYDTEYADVFGQYPKFVLLIADGDGNELESQHVPVRYRTDGLLTRIAWDLGEQFSGKIIMYK